MLSPVFKIIKLAFKLLFFSVVVLTLGHVLGWSGKSVSDRIRTQVAHAERWTDDTTEKAKEWVAEKGREVLPEIKRRRAALVGPRTEDDAKEEAEDRDPEKIPPSERQKLRNLIRELNGTQKRD